MHSECVVHGNGVRLAVLDFGGAGRPVVLVHGGPGPNAAAFGDLPARLSSGFRVVAYDQRGHGQSSDPPGHDYTWRTLADDLHAVIAQLGLTRPIVGGHSWGGAISLVHAASYPDEPAGVVVIDGPVTDMHDRPSTRRVSAFIRTTRPALHFVGRGLAAGLLRLSPDTRRISGFAGTDEELEDLLAWRARRDPQLNAAGFRRDFVRGTDGLRRLHHTVDHFLRMNLAVEAQRPLTTDVYAHIRCPVMLVGATVPARKRVWYFGRDAVERLHRQHPHLRVEWIEGGHDIPREHPAELAELVRDFAAMLPPEA